MLGPDDPLPLWTVPTDREDALKVRRTRPELPIVRLRSRAAAARWLAGPLAAT